MTDARPRSRPRPSGAPSTPAAPTSTVGDVVIGRQSLRVSDSGGGGVPLLLVNGLGANLEMWAPLRRVLGGRRTIAFDAPGTGGSTTPPIPRSIPGLAALTVALTDALEVPEFDLLGFSFGGAIAQQIAHDHPERVHRLVLASTTCGWGATPGDPLAFLTLLARAPVALLPPIQQSLQALTGDDAGPDAFSTSDDAWRRRPPNPLGYWWQLLAAAGWSSWLWLPKLRTPTLVLAGGHDRLAPPANARLLDRRLPDSTLTVFPEAGHFFLLADDPTPVARVICEFLDAATPVPTG